MRYFKSIPPSPRSKLKSAVYQVDLESPKWVAERWMDGRWEPFPLIINYVVDIEGDAYRLIEEITEAEARRMMSCQTEKEAEGRPPRTTKR